MCFFFFFFYQEEELKGAVVLIYANKQVCFTHFCSSCCAEKKIDIDVPTDTVTDGPKYQFVCSIGRITFSFIWNTFFFCLSFFPQDLPGALDDASVTEALELHKIKNRQWSIFKTSALKGEGLFEGLDWYVWSNSFLHCFYY